ncbi:MAG: hypothetical protein CSA20_06245 [Deltaproteobacteria bacterium]|nr:MAG: hypothetical protein CSA20_06245 [Deltaproteobacteria bacterium]
MGNLAKDHIVLRNLAPVLLDRSNFTLSAIIHYNFFYVFFFSDFIAKIGSVRSISSFFVLSGRSKSLFRRHYSLEIKGL